MYTGYFTSLICTSALLLVLTRAQTNTSQTPSVDLLSCDDLSCIDNDSSGVCQSNATLRTGVGMASNVLKIPGSDDSLSLTLIDGSTLGDLAGSGAWLTTQTLYAGIPSGFNASGQNDACALMLQYQAQTLPEDEVQATNTTSCISAFDTSTQNVFSNIINSFDHRAYGSSNATLPCCEALTQHINAQVRSRTNVGPWLSTFLTATGGALLGQDANTTVASPQPDGCQPVSPQEYELHPVASMNQFLYRSGPLLSNSNDAVADTKVGAGRTGVTPVVTVLYGNSQDDHPDVSYICMKTYAPDGEKLPQHSLSEDETSSGSLTVRSMHAAYFSVFVGLVSILF